MKTNTTATITADEIRAAIRYWLSLEKGIEVDGSISFDIAHEYDDCDWQGKWGTTAVVAGARFTVASRAPADED